MFRELKPNIKLEFLLNQKEDGDLMCTEVFHLRHHLKYSKYSDCTSTQGNSNL